MIFLLLMLWFVKNFAKCSVKPVLRIKLLIELIIELITHNFELNFKCYVIYIQRISKEFKVSFEIKRKYTFSFKFIFKI